MKKIFTLGLVLATTATAANAGWWQKLGFGKSAEPQTLEQACNTDEITAVCPDMLMGSQTMMECLSENVTSLSKKCAGFVKKYVTEHKDEVVEKANETVDTVKAEAAAVKAEAKQHKEKIKAQKQDVQNAVADITITVEQ